MREPLLLPLCAALCAPVTSGTQWVPASCCADDSSHCAWTPVSANGKDLSDCAAMRAGKKPGHLICKPENHRKQVGDKTLHDCRLECAKDPANCGVIQWQGEQGHKFDPAQAGQCFLYPSCNQTGSYTSEQFCMQIEYCASGPSPRNLHPEPGGSGGCDGGCAFLIVLLGGGFTYFAAGFAYNHVRNERRGADAIPHAGFWRDLPFLVKDGVGFAYSRVRQRGSDGGAGTLQYGTV